MHAACHQQTPGTYQRVHIRRGTGSPGLAIYDVMQYVCGIEQRNNKSHLDNAISKFNEDTYF